MITQAQLDALGRIARQMEKWTQKFCHMGAAPEGLRVYPINTKGEVWTHHRDGLVGQPFYYAIDPEGNIWTPKGHRPSWDAEGVRNAVLRKVA